MDILLVWCSREENMNEVGLVKYILMVCCKWHDDVETVYIIVRSLRVEGLEWNGYEGMSLLA